MAAARNKATAAVPAAAETPAEALGARLARRRGLADELEALLVERVERGKIAEAGKGAADAAEQHLAVDGPDPERAAAGAEALATARRAEVRIEAIERRVRLLRASLAELDEQIARISKEARESSNRHLIEILKARAPARREALLSVLGEQLLYLRLVVSTTASAELKTSTGQPPSLILSLLGPSTGGATIEARAAAVQSHLLEAEAT